MIAFWDFITAGRDAAGRDAKLSTSSDRVGIDLFEVARVIR
jgi:hypothetical protein